MLRRGLAWHRAQADESKGEESGAEADHPADRQPQMPNGNR
jgi:hypothetical protein